LDISKLIKSLLFIFVVLSLGVLIYKEFSPKSEGKTFDAAATRADKTTVSVESMPAHGSLPSKGLVTKQKEEASSPRTEVKAGR
jgi:hypothetical protein